MNSLNVSGFVLRVTIGALAITAGARAQSGGQEVFEPIKTERGMFNAKAKGTVVPGGHAQEVFLGRVPFSGPESGLNAPDPVLQKAPIPHGSVALPAGTITGLGVGFPNGFTVQYAPPDTNADVSASHIVQWVNAAYGIYERAAGTWAGPFAGNTPWIGFGGGCETNNDGDPIVKYDRATSRWVYTQFSVSNKPYLQCFAVSVPGDPGTIAARWAYSFGNKDFPDYPKMGIWPSGYFLSFNIFRNGFSFSGPRACAVDSATAIAGGSPKMICYQLSSTTGSLLPSDVDGPTAPPASSPNYFVAYGSNVLQFWKFTPDYVNTGASTFTGPSNVAVAPFSRACSGGACIPQPGTNQKLDSLADRLMYRNAYRNRGGTESLVVNHSVTPGNGAVSGIRWYEVRVAGGSFSIAQQSTYSPDTNARWMGSIAMNGAGSIAVGYSVSSGTVKPSISFTGRCSTDSPNNLQNEVTAVTGMGSQLTNLNRWGDYSSMVVDPADDTKFWFTTEYLQTDGKFNWSTAIVPISITCP
jgi:hypothetical protein